VEVKDALPIYPVLAQQAKVGGVVYLQAIIARDGSVKDVQVLRGNALLNEAAVAAVRQWRYSPTTLGGVPVEVILSVTVNFQIK
jgi:protein TonB